MKLSECVDHMSALLAFLGTEDANPTNAGHPDLFEVNSLVPIPCLKSGQHRASGGVFDIPIFDGPTEIGRLCLMSQLGKAGIEYTQITDHQKAACLALLDVETFLSRSERVPELGSDCVVIRREHVDRFLALGTSSALWGGFVLQMNSVIESLDEPDSTINQLNIEELSSPRTNRHAKALERAAGCEVPTDRFLHLYHFLELDYDFEIVKRIKELDYDNIFGLEKTLYTGRSELDRLNFLVGGLSAVDMIERVAFELRSLSDIAILVFYEYGKDTNPLPDKEEFLNFFLSAPAISHSEIRKAITQAKPNSNRLVDVAEYQKFLVRLSAYWVYRIRCCIAHNKLGEYHLNSPRDMKFVRDFGEPLIKSLIRFRLAS